MRFGPFSSGTTSWAYKSSRARERGKKDFSPRVRFPLERKEESVTRHNRDPESHRETQANDDEGVIVELLF